MKKKYILFSVIGIVVILIGYQLFTNKQQINEEKAAGKVVQTRGIPVMIDTVAYERVSNSLKKTGTLIPFKKAIVYAQTSGNLKQVNFELGDRVQKGKLLAVIDDKNVQIDLSNARAKANQLEQDLKIYQELLAGEATTQETVNQYQLDYTDAKNQVAQLEKEAYDSRLEAPLAGTITVKEAERGVYVNAGAELATVIAIDQLKVQIYLSEREIYQIDENDPVTITTDVYTGKTFKGNISYISPQADDTHNYLVEIRMSNTGESPLRSGTFVYADFKNETPRSVLTIPRAALLENTLNSEVYLVSDGKSMLKEVKLGQKYGDRVEIIEGLQEGELVITSGQINLKDQKAVTISKNTSK